jgi:tRNA A37 threonylcarbamoyladenosine modification protein TsaB
MARKPTAAEYQKRINEVYLALINGSSRQDIHRYASKKWGANDRSTDALIARARKRLDEEAAEYRATAMAEHLAARRQLRKQAAQDKDKRLVLEVLRDEAKLLGLYEPEKVQQEQDGKQRIEIVYVNNPDNQDNPDTLDSTT